MSRVGKSPIKIPQGVKIKVGPEISVEGPKGKLNLKPATGVTVSIEGAVLRVQSSGAENGGALQGLTRAILQNMVTGVSLGFTRELEIIGVGYRASTKGNILNLTVGYSHPVDFQLPVGVAAKVENNTRIVLTGADKALLGLVASQVRAIKPPEPYQGKGIRYVNEVIVKKEGKAAASAGSAAK